MRSKFVIRVLDALGNMLGWQEALALARGDGAMWLEEAMTIPIDVSGRIVYMSIHWADVNVEARVIVEAQDVKAGSSITVPPGEIMRVGPCAGGLPPVTLRNSINIGVPVGVLAAVGSR